ncbi:MAG: DUF4358 domain-containing protein [Oscillospiraceae bacterium]|nr:DUF4358 domain-containing protein [Oscillospiraceae bacterium]
MKKRKLAALLLAVSMGLAGCGSKPAANIDIDSLAAKLTSDVAFEDELSLIDDGMISMVYNNTLQWEDAVLYMGSGATAEEVAVFACADEAAAKAALNEAEAHIASQKESYESYVPEEVKRLDEAIVRQSGKYVVVVVTEDTAAAEAVLKEYLG